MSLLALSEKEQLDFLGDQTMELAQSLELRDNQMADLMAVILALLTRHETAWASRLEEAREAGAVEEAVHGPDGS